jgi:tRNA(fMet)-specific endonuclease VapC
MYVLDTDHVVILQTRAAGDYERLVERMNRHDASEFFVSIVSFHEQVLGWNAYISRAKNLPTVVRGYTRFKDLLEYYCDAQILQFDEAAADRFDSFRTARIRVPTMDLRIAAIAFSRGMTVLTRNLLDFQRVPGLNSQDWTGLP